MIRGRSERPSGQVEEPYRAVRDELVATEPRDVAHRLPNLVESVARASEEPDTERLLVGVSFSRGHVPLDYELARIIAREDGGSRRVSLKDAASDTHRYVRFTYPPDPQFDDCALRGALLSALEAELSETAFRTNGNGEHPAGDSLAGWLYGRLAALR